MLQVHFRVWWTRHLAEGQKSFVGHIGLEGAPLPHWATPPSACYNRENSKHQSKTQSSNRCMTEICWYGSSWFSHARNLPVCVCRDQYPHSSKWLEPEQRHRGSTQASVTYSYKCCFPCAWAVFATMDCNKVERLYEASIRLISVENHQSGDWAMQQTELFGGKWSCGRCLIHFSWLTELNAFVLFRQWTAHKADLTERLCAFKIGLHWLCSLLFFMRDEGKGWFLIFFTSVVMEGESLLCCFLNLSCTGNLTEALHAVLKNPPINTKNQNVKVSSVFLVSKASSASTF